MASIWQDILQSRIFTFVVGENKQEYRVHSYVLAKVSAPLHAMLHGRMREAQEGRVEWSDVDENTFGRFVEWLYTQDYATAEPDIVPDHSTIGTTSAAANAQAPEAALPGLRLTPHPNVITELSNTRLYCSESSGVKQDHSECSLCERPFTGYYCRSCGFTCYPDHCLECINCRTKCPSCEHIGFSNQTIECCDCNSEFDSPYCSGCDICIQKQCFECFVESRSHSVTPNGDLAKKFMDEDGTDYPKPPTTFTARKNTESCEDYNHVFLCHAKLYVIGDKYIIPELKQLALHRLHATLMVYALYPRRLQDIFTLVKYVFDNTMVKDKIRNMLTLYIDCVVKDVAGSDGMEELVDEVPGYAIGLIRRMSERLA